MLVLFFFLCIFLLTYSLQLKKNIWNIDYNLRKFNFIKYYIFLWVDIGRHLNRVSNAGATTFSWKKNHLLSVVRNSQGSYEISNLMSCFIVVTLTMQIFPAILGRDKVTFKAVGARRDSLKKKKLSKVIQIQSRKCKENAELTFTASWPTERMLLIKYHQCRLN